MKKKVRQGKGITAMRARGNHGEKPADKRRGAGFTLIEILIGVMIFSILAIAVYRGYSVFLDSFLATKTRVAAITLANEEMELIRNLPYDKIGTVGGIPQGVIPQSAVKVKDNIPFRIDITIRNIDDPFDGIAGGSPSDPTPADYKLVAISVQCTNCQTPETFAFTGIAAPNDLGTASARGILHIQAIDASGIPVSSANVQVINTALNPQVSVSDVTDISGFLKLVDVIPAAQSYRIIVTKPGFSLDQTYATSTQNPNPVKPDATVLSQQMTQATFVIDRVSALNISSVAETCAPVPNIDFRLSGAKLIGVNPNLLKFSQNYSTNASGAKSVSQLEWDSYSLTVTDSAYDLQGTIPSQPVVLAPNSAQDFRIVVKLKNPLSLLVTVLDAGTQLPLESASVTLTSGLFSASLTTGRGFLAQTDWSGGGGQAHFTNLKQYFSQDGNIEENGPAGELRLRDSGPSTYASSGWLESSTFDTGSPSHFYNFAWQPFNQPPSAGADPVTFQIATATTSAPLVWDFLGPDGTTGTYYRLSDTNINAFHNGDRFFRYRAYLRTADAAFTPNVSDISATFASDCVPPGQALFSGLAANTYAITVQKQNYQTFTDVVTVNLPSQDYSVSLSPF